MAEEEEPSTDGSMVKMSQSEFLYKANKALSDVMARHKKPARVIFEASSPTTQCFNTIGDCIPRKSNQTVEQGCKCWICGLPIFLLNDGSEFTVPPGLNFNKIKVQIRQQQVDTNFSDDVIPPHCEHILPVMTATFVLGGLYDSDFDKLPPAIKNAIKKNYLYAHPVCNLVKKNRVFINDFGKIDNDTIGNLIDDIFVKDTRSQVLNLANKKKFGVDYRIKEDVLAVSTSGGYKNFRSQRIRVISNKLIEVLKEYKEQVEKDLFGLLLLSGVAMATENFYKYSTRVLTNINLIKERLEAMRKITPKPKIKLEKLEKSLTENEAFYQDLLMAIGPDSNFDSVPIIPEGELLVYTFSAEENIKRLTDSVLNTTSAEIVDQLSLMKQHWFVQMYRPNKRIGKVEEDIISLFLNKLFKLTDLSVKELVTLPRGLKYSEGISVYYFKDIFQKLIQETIGLDTIEEIIGDVQGKIILSSIKRGSAGGGSASDKDDPKLSLIQGYEFMISLVQSIYLILLIFQYDEILKLPEIAENHVYLELIYIGRQILQQNLYDSLLSLYLKQPNYLMKCLTTEIFQKQIEKKTRSEFLPFLNEVIPDLMTRPIEVPEETGDRGGSRVLDFTIGKIIENTLPESSYCLSENQEMADSIMPLLKNPSQPFITRSSRLIERQNEQKIKDKLNQSIDEELEATATGAYGGGKTKKTRRKQKNRKNRKKTVKCKLKKKRSIKKK